MRDNWGGGGGADYFWSSVKSLWSFITLCMEKPWSLAEHYQNNNSNIMVYAAFKNRVNVQIDKHIILNIAFPVL